MMEVSLEIQILPLVTWFVKTKKERININMRAHHPCSRRTHKDKGNIRIKASFLQVILVTITLNRLRSFTLDNWQLLCHSY
jgi:hypothetical protein